MGTLMNVFLDALKETPRMNFEPLAPIGKAIKWAAGEVWEKINVAATWRELKKLGRKHGKRFFWAALIWECIEDGLFPFLSWLAGVPELIPLFLIFHFEPIAYPCIFWLFRMYDRARGLVPWDPPRASTSAYWRSVAKVGLYQATTLGWLWAFIRPLDGVKSLGVIAFFATLMTLFGFIHERVWVDSNFGVNPETDVVSVKRSLAKTTSYLVVASLVLWSALRAILPTVDWMQALGTFLGVGTLMYLTLEIVWSRSTLGLRATSNPIVEAK